MPPRKATIERLAVFSDGVFAVIIMVLDLRPPEHPTFAAILPLWPTALSYLVSYLFIAIVWTNHHHLLRFTDETTPRLIWINFAHLFPVSLVPFATVWVASTRIAAFPVFVYVAVFVLVELAYFQFEHHALARAVAEEIPPQPRSLAKNALPRCVRALPYCNARIVQVSAVELRIRVLRGTTLSGTLNLLYPEGEAQIQFRWRMV